MKSVTVEVVVDENLKITDDELENRPDDLDEILQEAIKYSDS